MRILIAASGGGHTGYAIALAQYLVDLGVQVDFIIPKGDSWTRKKAEKYGRVIAETTKFMGPTTPLWLGIAKAPLALLEALRRTPRGYDVVVSTGSNHSIPVAIAGKIKGAKLVSIESSVRFTKPSRAARILSPITDLLALQWPEQRKLLPRGVVVGPLYEKPEYEVGDDGYILVTTGTYGYKKLFDVLVEANVDDVVLQTGRVDPEPYRRLKPKWIVFDFDPDIGRWISRASVVVTHLGKTALDAALTYGKPVVIVPNPEWSRHGAGVEDARMFAQKLNAVFVEPSELSPSRIREAIEEARRRKPPRYPNGAKKLAELIVEKLV